MEIIGVVAFSAFAAACAITAFWHEIRWRKRLNAWERVCGRVIGVVDERPIKTLFGGTGWSDEGLIPRLSFLGEGVPAHSFLNTGGSDIPQVGTDVKIIFEPASGKAECLTFSNRWLFTVVSSIFSVVFFLVAFLG